VPNVTRLDKNLGSRISNAWLKRRQESKSRDKCYRGVDTAEQERKKKRDREVQGGWGEGLVS
jgi:hypothetical protein